jgi:hypothetical protein
MMGMTGGPTELPTPKVTLENVFVRGKGRLLSVRQSRPFDLDVKNALAALDGTLVDIDPSTADPSGAGSGNVHLTRVTAYLGGSLLHVRAAERKTDTAPFGLARTEVTATQCVFAPAGPGSEALVRADRLESREQVEKWVGWRGKDNVYGYDRKGILLEIRSGDTMPPKPVDGEGWLALAQEEGDDPFAALRFSAEELPAAGQARKFLSVRPAHFGPPRSDPPRSEVGAPTEVPVPFDDE